MKSVRAVLDNKWLFRTMAVWLLCLALAQLWPASWWFTVRSIRVGPAHSGEPIPMVVAREIHHAFFGEWHVSVRRWYEGVGMVVFCTASGYSQYRKGVGLPPELTLGWWTDSACSTLPEGKYIVSTLWYIDPLFLLVPRKHVQFDSNIFEVAP